MKLMEILDNEDISDIISWLPHGRGFVILDKHRFADEILPNYFKVAKFSSFNRRMNRWKFTLQRKSRNISSYFHPQFIRHNISDCLKMRPISQKVVKTKKIRNPTPVLKTKPDEIMTQSNLCLRPSTPLSFSTPSACIQNSTGLYRENITSISSDRPSLPYSSISTHGRNNKENTFQPNMEGFDTLLRNYYNHYVLETYAQHQLHLYRQMEAARLSVVWSMFPIRGVHHRNQITKGLNLPEKVVNGVAA